MSELTERVLVVVVTIICCVATIFLGPPVGTRKQKKQRKLPPAEARLGTNEVSHER
jgi:hypothetical protein